MTETGTILLVEDDNNIAMTFARYFRSANWTVHTYRWAESARRFLAGHLDEVDVAILDHRLKGGREEGLVLGEWIKTESQNRIPVVMWTADAEKDEFRRDADILRVDDVWKKGAQLSEFRPKLIALLRLARERREQGRAPTAEPAAGAGSAIQDRTLRRIAEEIDSYIARSLMPVLILGETGTGKERTARAIHEMSGLAGHFRVVNCAAFTPTLLMSELFGHVKGAFTGATEHRLGLIMEAAGVRAGAKNHSLEYRQWLNESGNQLVESQESMTHEFKNLGQETGGVSGTIFLDEVGDLPSDAQAAVLRFLDGYGIKPVGYSGLPLNPKVRIIAATNRASALFGFEPGPGEAVRQPAAPAEFRTDLLWRLAGWMISLPPLHRRAVPEVLRVAQDRALRFGEGDNKPQVIRGKRLSLTPRALEWLQREIETEQFSGPHPLRSGNYRNLNALIDRGCWITTFKNPSSREVDEDTLKEAAREIVLLSQRGERAEADPRLGEIPQPRAASPDRSANPAEALHQVRIGLAELAVSNDSHPAQYHESSDARVLDTRLVGALVRHLSNCQFPNPADRPLFWRCLEQPQAVFGEGTPAVSSQVRPRWNLLLTLSTIAACGPRDGGKYELSTVEQMFRIESKSFKERITKIFNHFGIVVKFKEKDDKSKQRKPLRELAQWFAGALRPMNAEGGGESAFSELGYTVGDPRGSLAFTYIRETLARELGLPAAPNAAPAVDSGNNPAFGPPPTVSAGPNAEEPRPG